MSSADLHVVESTFKCGFDSFRARHRPGSTLQLAAGNRPEKLIQYCSDDAYYRDPARPDGIRGKKALFEYFSKLLRKNPDWVWTAEEIIPTAKGFVLKWAATIPTASASVTVEGLDVLELSEDQITRNEVYFDRSTLLSDRG